MSAHRPRRAPALVGLLLAAGLAALPAGCGGSPWLDSRREAGSMATVGEATPDRPAVCHAAGAPPQAVQAVADAACARSNRRAVREGTEPWQCTVITPHRTFFACR